MLAAAMKNGAGTDSADEADASDLLARVLRSLIEEPVDLPASTMGRFRRMASAALVTGAGIARAHLRGKSGAGLDAADSKTIARLVLSLGELKGIAMKLGQVLSYIDESLPADTRQLLSLLQAHSQPVPFSWIEETLRNDLGPRAEVLLATMARAPAATASIGQVHRAELPGGIQVAVKVRHPGIEDAIAADFRGARLGKALAMLLAPGSNVDEVIAEARERFLEECDYSLERRRQSRFSALYAGHAVIRIPIVHDEWCSERVLTTTWQEGRSLDWFAANATQPERDRAGGALYEFYIGTLYRHGLFNADPHPGNLLFQDDGHVAVLDYGCVREFDGPTVSHLAALSRAMRHEDRNEIREPLRALGVSNPDGPGFEVTLAMLRGFFSPVLRPGVRKLEAGVNLEAREIMKAKRAMLRLQLPGKLLFLFRIRFGLYAVLSRLGAQLDWQTLEASLADTR